jgi:hypothetical protein
MELGLRPAGSLAGYALDVAARFFTECTIDPDQYDRQIEGFVLDWLKEFVETRYGNSQKEKTVFEAHDSAGLLHAKVISDIARYSDSWLRTYGHFIPNDEFCEFVCSLADSFHVYLEENPADDDAEDLLALFVLEEIRDRVDQGREDELMKKAG